jgi:hypothetical protein
MNPALRVLIGCERSGTVRDAFLRRGHDAWSCDLEPDIRGSNRHIRGDIRKQLVRGLWDLLIVLHPPCTRLCKSGLRWLHTPPPGRTLEEMFRELDEAADLFSACLNAPIKRKAIENPRMHKLAQQRIRNYRHPDQIAQPHQFGDPEFKGIGLWLEELPLLVETAPLVVPERGTEEWVAWSRVHRASGWGAAGRRRAEERSRFFPGIADAMADQWGGWANDNINAELAA